MLSTITSVWREKSGKRMRARSLLLQKPRINKLLSVRKDRDCYRVRLVTRSKRDPCMRRDVTIWRHGTEIGNCIWPIIDRTNSSSVVQLKIRRITKNSSSYLSCRIFCTLSPSLSLSLSLSLAAHQNRCSNFHESSERKQLSISAISYDLIFWWNRQSDNREKEREKKSENCYEAAPF